MNIAGALVVLFSVLVPTRTWYPPDAPILVDVQPTAGAVTLVLTDFAGKTFEPKEPADVESAGQVNVSKMFGALTIPGTYILYAVPKGGDVRKFVGTPLLIEVRSDKRAEAVAGVPMVSKVSPLVYAVIETDAGNMTVAFYYDVAPNTAAAFIDLARGGFYDGLSFHRIVENFVIQGGDPKGDSSGGPGFNLEAEFSDRPHDVGVLSMARSRDPVEAEGAMPRPQYANSGGSQFFIALNRETTKQLDRRYSVFGKVVKGLDVVEKIGKSEVDKQTGKPSQPIVIKSLKIMPVKAEMNPYEGLLTVSEESKSNE